MTTQKQINAIYSNVVDNGPVAQRLHCGSSTHVMTVSNNNQLVKTMRVDTMTHTLEVDIFDKFQERTTHRQMFALNRGQSYKLEQRFFKEFFD